MGKTQATLILTVIFLSSMSFAQATAVAVEAKKEVAAETAAAQAPVADVVIVQQAPAPIAPQPAVQVIEQPTTVVTASPLTASRAEELRKQRERAEIETEQKIVEKLESSRLEDEQKRLNNLFGNKLDGQQEQVEQAPAVVAAPVAPVAPAKSEEELKSEIASQVRADLEAARAEEAKNQKPRYSVGGVLATMDYPDASNVSSDFGAGFALNWINPNRVGIELSALFSQATLDESYSLYKEIDQQNWVIATKYYFLPGNFTPVVGGLLSATHREYTDMYQWGYGAVQGARSAESDSLDLGLILGVQFSPSKNVSFGIDYRWLTNMETRYSEPQAFNRSVYQGHYDGFQPLEEIDYQFINMSMNFVF